MADAISSLASVQLSVLQLPEIARESTPVLLQSQIAAAQAPAIIAQQDQDAAETVQMLEELGSSHVPDALSGNTFREPAGYRSPERRSPGVQEKTVSLAAAHPRGLGSLVDVRA